MQGVCVLLIYTISPSIICVSKAGFSPVESNKWIYDIYNLKIFEKQRHWEPPASKFLYHQVTQCNTGDSYVHPTGDVNAYLYMCRSIGPCACLFV